MQSSASTKIAALQQQINEVLSSVTEAERNAAAAESVADRDHFQKKRILLLQRVNIRTYVSITTINLCCFSHAHESCIYACLSGTRAPACRYCDRYDSRGSARKRPLLGSLALFVAFFNLLLRVTRL